MKWITKRQKRIIKAFFYRFATAASLAILCVFVVGMVKLGAHAINGVYTDSNSTEAIKEINDTKPVSSDNSSLSEYEVGSNSNVAVNNIGAPHLVLVNKDNPLPSDYKVELRSLKNWGKSVAESVYNDLNDMLEKGSSKGLVFCIASAFRDSERQEELLKNDIQLYMNQGMNYDEAYNKATRTVMPEGHSEHETGLALDIVAISNQRLDDSQQETPENIWLQENCDKFGFILRYPKGKEEITKVSYESWHFRYVGKEAAKYIMENNLTLEEYLEEQSKKG